MGNLNSLKRLCGLLLSFLNQELGLALCGQVQIYVLLPFTPNISVTIAPTPFWNTPKWSPNHFQYAKISLDITRNYILMKDERKRNVQFYIRFWS